MDALRHRTHYVTSSSNVHFMCSFYGDFMDQWMVCISVSYPQITCCSIGFEKLQRCISLGEIPAWINTTAVHIENPTRWNSVSKFYFIFIWSSTCFRQHTTHHQEPKTALAASGFAYVESCWPCSCWTLTADAEIKFWYTVASCWIFYMNYTMMHGSTNNSSSQYQVSIALPRRRLCMYVFILEDTHRGNRKYLKYEGGKSSE
jgi:hypothetical protein